MKEVTEETPRFHAVRWERLKGAFCAIVLCDKERPRDESGLVGVLVLIDDESFECIRVWAHKPGFPMWPGEEIGLEVREVPA